MLFAICHFAALGGAPLPLRVDLVREVEEEALVVLEFQLLVRADVDDEVVAALGGDREFVLREAEGLAEVAFDAVSADGVAYLAPDRQAQAAAGEGVGAAVDGQGAGGPADAGAVGGLELPRVGEAL